MRFPTVLLPAALVAVGFTAAAAPRPVGDIVPWPSAPLTVADTGGVRFVLAPAGNEVRYRVREQLVRLSFPSDAISSTTNIQGALMFGDDGSIDSAASRFVIDLASLESDSRMRDGYVRRNVFETDSFPSATFVPSAATGLPWPLPDSGRVRFQLAGDMTVHGTTAPTTWTVIARIAGDDVTGTASTRFKFADFHLRTPKVGSVLSVEDDIRLEYEFHFVREEGQDQG